MDFLGAFEQTYSGAFRKDSEGRWPDFLGGFGWTFSGGFLA